MDLSGVGIYSTNLRFGDPAQSAEAAAELEQLGYDALWIPDAGGAVFDAADHLLSATQRVVVATGVLNLWMHTPRETAAGYASLSAIYPNRFLMGVGVSHAELVDSAERGRYRKPLAAMARYLEQLDGAESPVPVRGRVLAALGPKMLELAGARARGVHSYLVTPDHTRRARQLLGSGALVLPEQTVVLCSAVDEARAVGTGWLQHYLARPNYANNLFRLGFTRDDVMSISDRLFDAVIGWGDEERIKRRIDEHRSAGADHVCIQVLTSDPKVFPREHWRRLAAALN